MGNEWLFLLQILLIVGFSLAALRLGAAALTTWVTTQALIANLFVLKQIVLFGFNVTASDAFAIGSLLGLNFLQEHFTRAEAQRATWISFIFMLFFAVCSQLHILYTPSTFDNSHAAFAMILSPTPRLLLSSLLVFFITQQCDVRLFALLKRKWPSVSFSLRAAITLICSQCVDTVLFSILGLYGIVASVFDIIIISLLIKCLVILSFSSVTKWIKVRA